MAVVKQVPAVLPAQFGVYGRPRTKGSLNVYCMKNATHKVRVEEETKDSSLWRARVAKAAQNHMMATTGGLWNVDHAVSVRALFVFPRQESVNGGVVPSHDTPWPTDITIGDVDKLARNILDAMEDAHLYRNDRLVAQLLVEKTWATDELPVGVTIRVAHVSHTWWAE